MLIDLARTKCELDYANDGASTTTVLCTLLILIFAIILEFAVLGTLKCCDTVKDDPDDRLPTAPDATSEETLLPTIVVEQPEPLATPVDTPQTSTADQDVEQAKKKCDDTLCHPNPSPNVRANRFLAAVLLYAVVLTAFIIRIHNIDHPYIRPECRHYVGKWTGSRGGIPGPNWWAVVLLNIIPFVASSFSLIRTVVDCFLVRWGQGLSYDVTESNTSRAWPPCVSIFLVAVLLYTLVDTLLAWPIALLMGRPRSSASSPSRGERRGEDIEMQGEELRGLIDGVDEEDDGGERVDEPPAYDEAVHQEQDGAKEEKADAVLA